MRCAPCIFRSPLSHHVAPPATAADLALLDKFLTMQLFVLSLMVSESSVADMVGGDDTFDRAMLFLGLGLWAASNLYITLKLIYIRRRKLVRDTHLAEDSIQTRDSRDSRKHSSKWRHVRKNFKVGPLEQVKIQQ